MSSERTEYLEIITRRNGEIVRQATIPMICRGRPAKIFQARQRPAISNDERVAAVTDRNNKMRARGMERIQWPIPAVSDETGEDWDEIRAMERRLRIHR